MTWFGAFFNLRGVFLSRGRYEWKDGMYKQNPAFQIPNSFLDKTEKIRDWNHKLDQNTQNALDKMNDYIEGKPYVDYDWTANSEWTRQPVEMPKIKPMNYDVTELQNVINSIDFDRIEFIVWVIFIIALIFIIAYFLIKYKRVN